MMFGISILLVSLILGTIALSLGILGDSVIFPFLSKDFVYGNILVVSFLFLVFVESYFLFHRLNTYFKKPEKVQVKQYLGLVTGNLAESAYYICLLLPFIALCKVFLAYEFAVILPSLCVFAFFIIIFRANIFFLTLLNVSFESYMRVFLILTFVLPLFAFCIWEFTGVPASLLSYFSPAWFLMEVLRRPTLVVYPFFIIWLVPTFLSCSISLRKLKKMMSKSVEGSNKA